MGTFSIQHRKQTSFPRRSRRGRRRPPRPYSSLNTLTNCFNVTTIYSLQRRRRRRAKQRSLLTAASHHHHNHRRAGGRLPLDGQHCTAVDLNEEFAPLSSPLDPLLSRFTHIATVTHSHSVCGGPSVLVLARPSNQPSIRGTTDLLLHQVLTTRLTH